MADLHERYGAIEAGGTKFICAVGDARGEILESIRIATRDPVSTLRDVFEWFTAAQARLGPLRCFGVGGFGPLELRRDAPNYGFVTNTPKPGWRLFDLRGEIARHFDCPVAIDTDVNAAALAELQWGAGKNLESLAYVTVGTGIGVGFVQDQRAVHGLVHPEAGHIFVRRHPEDHDFPGICPFHGDCLEGLASGPAILARTGHSLAEAAPGEDIWEIEADYLGQLALTLLLTHSPQRLVFGGGVMKAPGLLDRVHARMHAWLRGYMPQPEIASASYIQLPGLGDNAGIKGALSLALRECAA